MSSTTSTAPVPALSPPPGVVSNFENPESLKRWSSLCAGLCITVVTLFFCVRNYVRIYVKQSWILEDYMTTISFLGTIAYMAVMIITMDHHGGIHEWDLTAAQTSEAIYFFNVGTLVYGPTICCIKVAILLLFRRVFSPNRGTWFDRFILWFIGFVVLFYTTTTLVKIFECHPREKIWNHHVEGSCVNVSALLDVSGLVNTVTDFIILFIPIKSVWKLNMALKKKLAVITVFTLGLCAPVFSVVGVVVRLQITGSKDQTWTQPGILLWAAAELTTGFLCICAPETNALFAHRRRKAAYYNGYSGGNSSHTATVIEMNRSEKHGHHNAGAASKTARTDSEQDLVAHGGLGLGPGPAVSEMEGGAPTIPPMSTVGTTTTTATTPPGSGHPRGLADAGAGSYVVSIGPTRSGSLSDDPKAEVAPFDVPFGGVHVQRDVVVTKEYVTV